MKFIYTSIIFLCLLGSCKTAEYSKMSTSMNAQDRQESADSNFEPTFEEDRKVLYSANLNLAVKNRDSTASQIAATAKRYNGYVNETGTYRCIIRVKSDQLNSAIEDLSTLGKVTSKNIHGADVTESYLDSKLRLDNAEKSRNRYLELLEKAVSVQEILLVEKELERLNVTIEMLKGKMNRIDHLDEFSTITINLRVKKKPGILGYVFVGAYEAVKWLFVRN